MQVSRQRIETNDFEVFTEAEEAMGVRTDKMQLSAGRGSYLANYVQLGEITVWRYRSSHRIRHQYEFPSDLVEISISQYATPFHWCGREVAGASLAVQQGDCDYDCITPSSGSVYGFVFPRTRLLEWGVLTADQLSRMFKTENALSMTSDPFQRRFLKSIDRLVDQEDSTISPTSVLGMHESVLDGCQRILDDRFQDRPNQPLAPSVDLIGRAQELIVHRLEEPLTAAEIASELGVSRRSLELGFRKVLGVSPYQFLLVTRLHSARRILKADECTVLEACSRTGFTNTGRFANMYARQFGELPSQTKRKDSNGNKVAG